MGLYRGVTTASIQRTLRGHNGSRMRAAMRVIPNAVVLSSLLVVASAGAQPTPTPAPAGGGSASAPAGDGSGAQPADLSQVKPEDMPTAVRLRRLEQKTQALKERS